MLPPYNTAVEKPRLPAPPPPLPTLSVNEKGRVYLHKAITERLNFRPHMPIELVQPAAGSPYWHLDLRPSAAYRLSWAKDQHPRIVAGVGRQRGIEPGQPLTLYLLPGEPAIADYYPLLPEPAFYNAYLAFLEAAALAARTSAPRPLPGPQ